MPRQFTHLAFILFIITALSGIWLRTFPYVTSFINYDHVLHGHSHIAILGWAFFGLYLIFLKILWPTLKQKKHAIILGYVIFFVSLIMFFAFLYEGYATYSIIMSTIHIFVEYWAIVFIFRRLKEHKELPTISKLFVKGALISLFLSTLGPFALGYLGATGLKESPLFDMSIYYFLHFQYNGFLTLFLIGLFFTILSLKNIPFLYSRAKTGFWVYFIALFPWFVSAILWADLGGFARVIAAIGSIGQFIGVILLITAFLPTMKDVKTKFTRIVQISLYITIAFLLAKSMMELGLIYPKLSELVFDTRSVIIGYLHLTLLGFISLFIITQFYMVRLTDVYHKTTLYGMFVFLAGFIINELVLFLLGLSSWTKAFSIPNASAWLLFASILLMIGICFYWVSVNRKHT